MPIKILCLGDIVGKPGRMAVAELLPKAIAEKKIDLVVANAENAAGGSGLTPPIYNKLLKYGVDAITLGDHTYRKREVLPLLETAPNLIRPGNFPPPPASVGKGWCIVKSRSGIQCAVLQVMGKLHMNPQLDDPFRAIDKMLTEIPPEIKIKIVDFHAEVSSEKIAMGWHLSGRVSVVFGTHTHTPTADFRILPGDNNSPGSTAFVSDVGMTGPYDSILGRRKDRVLKHLLTGMPHFFEVATGDPRMCGILATIDEIGGHALSIERCDLKGTEQQGAYDADDKSPGAYE